MAQTHICSHAGREADAALCPQRSRLGRPTTSRRCGLYSSNRTAQPVLVDLVPEKAARTVVLESLPDLVDCAVLGDDLGVRHSHFFQRARLRHLVSRCVFGLCSPIGINPIGCHWMPLDARLWSPASKATWVPRTSPGFFELTAKLPAKTLNCVRISGVTTFRKFTGKFTFPRHERSVGVK